MDKVIKSFLGIKKIYDEADNQLRLAVCEFNNELKKYASNSIIGLNEENIIGVYIDSNGEIVVECDNNDDSSHSYYLQLDGSFK